MTVLSINVNKIALLRNSRGRDFPNVVNFVEQALQLGVKGITVHPRPDERHITRQDVFDISDHLTAYSDVEFNIEGYPSEQFLDLVCSVKPAQATLVPDAPGQLTSDHGWDVAANEDLLSDVLERLRDSSIRSSLFIDPSVAAIEQVPAVKADRVELYTEEYAASFGTSQEGEVFNRYFMAATRATELGIGLNAGHDLDLVNLPRFLKIPNILEVSIGHALVVESLQYGMSCVIEKYLAITRV
ncbi:MAG: pyridoxine 5'-phosphate synthase [Gammaproteobacteria bacterium]|nr:pyridoxine 5'-phosphate synthase [Gammaproteobacteria bacterium]MDP6094871.1 pyridoxine 5'-phosphate synthase [Gammaproteobacteria bacterium]MDP7455645.1 pyridoxine 5'-phosphate synthase [Gammaproteobacteria bacterium]